ncbi:hypothetical protein SNOUR_24390 [Streptomyces noursei ATCC 11455]|nr:hypothetical protein SNOUR_24390 [Streptomyces noursei ATCC 11455]
MAGAAVRPTVGAGQAAEPVLAEAVDLLSEDEADDVEDEVEEGAEDEDVEEVEPLDDVELPAGLLLDDEPRLSLR